MTKGGVGVRNGPKKDDVIYEQPVIHCVWLYLILFSMLQVPKLSRARPEWKNVYRTESVAPPASGNVNPFKYSYWTPCHADGINVFYNADLSIQDLSYFLCYIFNLTLIISDETVFSLWWYDTSSVKIRTDDSVMECCTNLGKLLEPQFLLIPQVPDVRLHVMWIITPVDMMTNILPGLFLYIHNYTDYLTV